MPRRERIVLVVLAVTALILRAVLFFRYRFDSDEPQHLHVAWAWTDGLTQYRDVFDNHTPLFHILTAPLLDAIGRRADVLLFMRLPMLLLFAVVVWCTYVLGRRWWSHAIGVRAATLLMLFPPFFLKSLEYRNDNLWNAFWMLSVVAAPNPFAAGFFMGAALATSMKTALLILATGAALIATRSALDRRSIALAAAGFVVVPAIVGAFLTCRGALPASVHCLVTLPGLVAQTREGLWWLRLIVPLVAALLVFLIRRRTTISTGGWILILYLTIAGSFWVLPLVGMRDFLTMMPLAAVFASAGIEHMRRRALLLIAIGAIFVASLFYYADRFQNRTDEYITMMNQFLRLARPGDPAIDYKGELVYARRPFYYALEIITRRMIERGVIADTIPEDVVRYRCHIAQADGPIWSPRGKAFLLANFINLGRLRASGQWIADDGSFTIAVSGSYLVVSERGIAKGILDKRVETGPRTLEPGPHRFERATPGERIAVLWAPAFERGLSPFHLQDLDF